MKAGDVVLHLRNARRMYVESVDGRAWFDAEGLHRGCYGIDWLIPKGVALA